MIRRLFFISILIVLASVIMIGCGEENPASETTTASDEGKKLYENNCLACHGEQGQGGHNGPNLQKSNITSDRDQVISKIENGEGVMPSFKDKLSEEEISSIATYITDVVAKIKAPTE